MARLDPGLAFRTLLRGFALQGSWNYETMQGTGLAFTLEPSLARAFADDPQALREALRRHAGFFNAHPYLATIAVGAVARLELDRASVEEVERMKNALVGPLGTLGDRLIWARWRPLCALAAALLFVVGVPWWIAIIAFLVVYNAMHVALRIWGLRIGWREGRQVGKRLLGSPLRRMPDRLTIPLAAVSGALLPLLVMHVDRDGGVGFVPLLAIASALAALGFVRPADVGRAVGPVLVAASLAFVILGTVLR